MSVPSSRRRIENDRPIRDGAFVLYWMRTARRTSWNFALDHSLAHAEALGVPLCIVETVSLHRWIGRRHVMFVAGAMTEHAAWAERYGVGYVPGVLRDDRPELVTRLARKASLVVADLGVLREDRCALKHLADDSPCRIESIDGLGLFPVAATPRAFPSAHGFRRFLQKSLRDHLLDAPNPSPTPHEGLPRWTAPTGDSLKLPKSAIETGRMLLQAGRTNDPSLLRKDFGATDEVVPATGGIAAARCMLEAFLRDKLPKYAAGRNHPDDDATSGLSPWLHEGFLSPHEVFARLADNCGWSPDDLGKASRGSREGWWGMPESHEAFLDQLVTWRELGMNMCFHRDDYDAYASLPDWARETLEAHAADPRPYSYSLEQFAAAGTHDPLWNAAQRQLRREGVIHNYLRMLWGKKILHWTPTPQDALAVMIALNNRYAIDGNDPNSYSGIFWVLGRYDRAWGPERPVFGKIRYVTSESAARKLRLRVYQDRYSE
ncbi:deoxyribodipyrimidine photolyase [Thermostilla marina]